MYSSNYELYLSLFAISFISNALPFGGAPYTLIGAFYADELGLFNVIVVTALGATLAKVVLYALGFGTKRIIKKNKNYEFFKRIVGKRSFIVALFIASVIPGLPVDDFLYLWGGAVKGSLPRMLIVTFIAKITKSTIEIPMELLAISSVSNIIGVNLLENTYFQIASVTFFIILGMVLFIIDWEKTINYLREKVSWLLKSSNRENSPFL